MPNKNFLLLSLEDSKTKKIANVVSNESCKKILDYLAKKEATESELAEKLQIPISTVHYNLQQLMETGLINTEEYHYSWEFDRDISQLRPGDRFIVSARNELMTESCDDGLDASSLFIRGNVGPMPSSLIRDRLTPETEHHFWGNTEGLYGKRGPKEKSVEMGIDEDAEGPFQWFEVNIYPGHGGGAVRYQIVYWYEAG